MIWRHYEGMLTCSECGAEFYDDIMEYLGDDVPKFCPDCGARAEKASDRRSTNNGKAISEAVPVLWRRSRIYVTLKYIPLY